MQSRLYLTKFVLAFMLIVFQGYDYRSYVKAAVKLLIAGFIGVCVGWVLQPFFTTVFHIPYWAAYWPAVLGGYIANLRSQVKMRNLKLEKKNA